MAGSVPISRYNALPRTNDAATTEVRRIHEQGLFVPRDFDVSPYFQIIKPTLEQGFDPHLMPA